MLDSEDFELLKKLGSTIRKYRKNLSLTIDELAEMSGISGKYLQGVEVGIRNISVKNLANIAYALNIETSDFFLEENEDDIVKNKKIAEICDMVKDFDDKKMDFIENMIDGLYEFMVEEENKKSK